MMSNVIATNSCKTSYDEDFYAWTQEQSRFLKEGNFSQLDIENLAEEIAALGAQQLKELVNRLKILLMHLLKWEFQPAKRTRSWILTIKIQRTEISHLIQKHPSLKAKLEEAIKEAFEVSRLLAAEETGLTEQTFPPICPYTLEEILAPQFPDISLYDWG